MTSVRKNTMCHACLALSGTPYCLLKHREQKDKAGQYQDCLDIFFVLSAFLETIVSSDNLKNPIRRTIGTAIGDALRKSKEIIASWRAYCSGNRLRSMFQDHCLLRTPQV
jgi:hypothetical protein